MDILAKQNRSKERISKILDAAINIIEEGEVDDLTLAKVAQISGLKRTSTYKFIPTVDFLRRLFGCRSSSWCIQERGGLLSSCNLCRLICCGWKLKGGALVLLARFFTTVGGGAMVASVCQIKGSSAQLPKHVEMESGLSAPQWSGLCPLIDILLSSQGLLHSAGLLCGML